MQGVGMRGTRSQATHILFLLLLPGLTPLLSLCTDRAGKAGFFTGGLLRKPCRRHPRLCVPSGVLSHRDREGSLPRVIRQETASRIIRGSFGGHGPSDLAVPPAWGTSPKRDALFPACPGGTRGRSRDPSTHAPGEITRAKPGFLVKVALVWVFCLHLSSKSACRDTLHPKGLSIWAAPAKTWRGWRHTFKPGQAVTVNSSYSRIKSLQAHTCRKVNLSPLALRQEMPWQSGARLEWGQMCQLCLAWKKMVLPTAEGSSAVPICGSTGTAGMALGLVWGTAGSVVPV